MPVLAQVSPVTEVLAGTGVVGLLVAAGLLTIRLIRLVNQQVDHVREEEESLRAERDHAEWQVHLMIGAMRQAGVPIPDAVWHERGTDELP